MLYPIELLGHIARAHVNEPRAFCHARSLKYPAKTASSGLRLSIRALITMASSRQCKMHDSCTSTRAKRNPATILKQTISLI